MKKPGIYALALVAALTACATAADPAPKTDEPGFVSLFDGKSLAGWKVGKNADTFQVRDGMIVVNGPVAHLFYTGDVGRHDFKSFVFKADVMTYPKANSGIYFHTRFQEAGWPSLGLECQVNNSHTDWRRTGSLYGLKDLRDVPAKDNVWYTHEIVVQGDHITVKIDGRTILEYTMAEADKEHPVPPTRQTWLPRGTFALQGHDPGSKVCYKNIRVKILPD